MTARKDKQLAEIHLDAVTQFARIQAGVRGEREQCLSDRRFYCVPGATWEGPHQAMFEHAPKFEVNKTHSAVVRIVNDYRNSLMDMQFLSKDGTENDELADICASLYRADAQDSVASDAYDNGFEEAVAGGFGAWRLCAEYEDDESEEDDRQRIKIEPIYEADSCVFFDLDAKRPDKSDAKHCFVLTSYTHEAYEEEFGDSPATWARPVTESWFDWSTPDLVYVAEYYVIEEEKEEVQTWVSLQGEESRYRTQDLKDDPEFVARLKAIGSKRTKKKMVTRRRVHKYLLSGEKILEDCGYLAGRDIPIIPVFGKRWIVDGIERCQGHVRTAVDAQRLANMQRSKLGEIAALSSMEKPILTPQQIAGFKEMWEADNISKYPYLLINPETDGSGNKLLSGPVGYTRPAQIPPATAALLQITEQDLSDLLGSQRETEQLQPGISGAAISQVQNKLDVTGVYIANMAKAIKRTGQVWLGMARDLYTEDGRRMKIVEKTGAARVVTLREKRIGHDGSLINFPDLAYAKFDVQAEPGPGSATKRQATVKNITGMMTYTQDPETMQVLSAMALMNMEGEGMQDVRAYFRKKLLRLGAVKPTDQEAQELMQEQANQPKDANTLYLQAAAQQAAAEAGKAQADTALKLANVEKTQAETVKVLTDIDQTKQDQAMEVLDRLEEDQRQQQTKQAVVAIVHPAPRGPHSPAGMSEMQRSMR